MSNISAYTSQLMWWFDDHLLKFSIFPIEEYLLIWRDVLITLLIHTDRIKKIKHVATSENIDAHVQRAEPHLNNRNSESFWHLTELQSNYQGTKLRLNIVSLLICSVWEATSSLVT